MCPNSACSPSPFQPTVRTFICRHLSRFCHLRWVAINASLLLPLRCQLIKIDAKYAKSRENPRGKFSKFSQLISQVTHAQQITRGVAGGSATGCSFLHMPYPSLSLSCLQCAWYYCHAPFPASLKQLVFLQRTRFVCICVSSTHVARHRWRRPSPSCSRLCSPTPSSSLSLGLSAASPACLPVLAGWRQQ